MKIASILILQWHILSFIYSVKKKTNYRLIIQKYQVVSKIISHVKKEANEKSSSVYFYSEICRPVCSTSRVGGEVCSPPWLAGSSSERGGGGSRWWLRPTWRRTSPQSRPGTPRRRRRDCLLCPPGSRPHCPPSPRGWRPSLGSAPCQAVRHQTLLGREMRVLAGDN